MAYQIDKYNGTFLVSIEDQTLNTTATDLRIVGRNYAGWGEIHNENFVHLLENFASASAPTRSLEGQIWYDAQNKKIKFFDGSNYRVVGGAEVSASAPPLPSTGDFWFNSTEKRLYTWDGSNYNLIGPPVESEIGDTLTEAQIVKDQSNTDRPILKIIVGSEIIGILSSTEFILNSIINPIAGFTKINKGFTLVNLGVDGFATTSDHRFWGTASNTVRFAGLPVEEFLRANNVVFPTQVRFGDNGFVLGDQNDLRIRVINGNEPVIENQLDGSIYFRISAAGSDIRDVALVRGDGFLPGRNETYDLGKPAIRWNEVNAKTMRADTFYGKLIGTLEPPPVPAGQEPEPIRLQKLVVSDDFVATGNVNIDLLPPYRITAKSGTLGFVDNVNINPTLYGFGNFTDITATSTITITGTTQSTLSTNGALKVAGGVGIAKNLNVAGEGAFLSTGAVKIPAGTTAQRPSTALMGMIRYNTDIENFEGFDGVEWRIIGAEQQEDWGDLLPHTLEVDWRFVNEAVDSNADFGQLF